MSVFLVFTPALAAAWPTLVPAITGAVAALGYSLVRGRAGQFKVQKGQKAATGVELSLEHSEVVGKALSADEELTYDKEGVRVTFFRDASGRMGVHVSGPGKSEDELRRIGTELAQKVTQQFVYNNVMTELKKRNFAVVDERVDANDSVKIRVRQRTP